MLTNTYDSAGRVQQQELGDGGIYNFAYATGAGGAITRTDVTDPRGGVWRVTFDANGHVSRETEGLGTAQSRTTVLTHDADGLLQAQVDPLGRRTEIGYDAVGLPTTLTTLAGTAREATWTAGVLRQAPDAHEQGPARAHHEVHLRRQRRPRLGHRRPPARSPGRPATCAAACSP